MIASFAAGEPMTVQTEAPLRLSVLNGNGKKGSAGRLSEVLADQGFEILTVGDADRNDVAITTVVVRPDSTTRAQAIIDALGFGQISTGSVDSSLDAIVIVGLDADRTPQSG